MVIAEAREVLDNLDEYSNVQEEKDALQDAYDTAVAVYENEEATQDEVAEATLNLNAALAVMRRVPSRDALAELVNEMSNKDLSKYC